MSNNCGLHFGVCKTKIRFRVWCEKKNYTQVIHHYFITIFFWVSNKRPGLNHLLNKRRRSIKKYEGLQVAEYSIFVRSNQIFALKVDFWAKKWRFIQSGALIKSGDWRSIARIRYLAENSKWSCNITRSFRVLSCWVIRDLASCCELKKIL